MDTQEKKELIIEAIKKLDEITIVKTYDKLTRLISFDEIKDYESYKTIETKTELYRILGEIVYKDESQLENNNITKPTTKSTTNNTVTQEKQVKQED